MNDIAAFLQDFCAVLTEEVARVAGADIEWEAKVMQRVNKLIKAFREGDYSTDNAYATRCPECQTKMAWAQGKWKCPECGKEM